MTFDPACEFLLDMGFANLFEPAADNEIDFRCKGCGEPVKRWEREAHYARHRRERERQQATRAERARREGIARLRAINREKRLTSAAARPSAATKGGRP